MRRFNKGIDRGGEINFAFKKFFTARSSFFLDLDLWF
jgi:hypothetical protein